MRNHRINLNNKFDNYCQDEGKFKNKYSIDSGEASPVEEVLNCEPVRFDSSPTEIINISSPPSENFHEEINGHQKWKYERENIHHTRPESVETEDIYPVSPPILENESGLVYYDKNVSQFENDGKETKFSYSVYNQNPKQNEISPPRSRLNQTSKDLTSSIERSSPKRRSSGSLNRVGNSKSHYQNNFETKRQEVLK